MKDKKFLIVAQFEFMETVRKPSFWLATFFLPILIAAISFVSGYSSIEASKSFEKIGDQFKKIYIVDNANVISPLLVQDPIELVTDVEAKKEEVRNDPSELLVIIPSDFKESLSYELIYKKGEELLAGISMPPVINSYIKQSALVMLSDQSYNRILTQEPSTIIKSYDENNELKEEGFDNYILPLASLIIFFFAVFISSSFLLESVSAEKENRMIETMLSIVEKKSLMIGKMLGLTSVVFLQLIIWLGLGAIAYISIQNYLNIEIPINFQDLDLSILPVNIYLIITGFAFFASIMTGVGAVGTGAQDSKNLSAIFIMLSIFPMYLMQILVTDPNGQIAKIFTYFPFTSYMILLVRNSLGALTQIELITGLVLTTVYVLIAGWLALKLFELGCLMYNRRPTFSEILKYLKIS